MLTGDYQRAVQLLLRLVPPTFATSEVYAGKEVAALDRQHPRDLFEVWVRDQEGG
jgi:hypothetical protein